jgi:diguanylate cyclase (GGDEF)-like protein
VGIDLFKFSERSIYLDPLTSLPNFFKFVESDVHALFDKCGSVIIFDLIKFRGINEKYGNEVGDLCLKTLSHIIMSNLANYYNSKAFRTDGDEFTVILPKILQRDARNLGKLIKADFKDEMIELGFEDINLRSFIVEYNEEISSISKFYLLILQGSKDREKTEEENVVDERLMDHIIDGFTRRISETLSFFNDAYILAMADDISGLPNHRAGKSFLYNLIESSKQTKDVFSILFIDGDNLKKYNEISYQTGNKMIRDLSDIINNSLRKNDRVFRWFTGDEFLVVLPDVDTEDAYKLAERTRMAVEDQTKKWVYPVTISIGVAHYANDDNDIEDIINKAEKANSLAKNLGKNRVVKWNITYEDIKTNTISCG